MIKLIFSDMDGTLLDEHGKLPAEFPAIYEKLRAKGIRFVPASGRQYYSLRETFAPYEAEMIFLADNGTMVVDSRQELFASEINRDLAMEVLSVGTAIEGVHTVFCGKRKAFILPKDDIEPFRLEVDKYVTHAEVICDFPSTPDIPIKMSFCDLTGHSGQTIYPHLEHFADRFQVVQSSNEWVDVINLDINKGVAVKLIQEKLGVSPDECVAFGDFFNDVEMLQSVKYSFAMANAQPRIKELARYEAPSNVEHGVMKVIEDLLAGKYVD